MSHYCTRIKSYTVCKAVKINSIAVPSRYELKEDADMLILDCDFTVNTNETGFVLKWLHNSVSIYQWIPSKKVPFALVINFRDFSKVTPPK